MLQDKASIASDTSLVFSQLNINGMLKALNDLSAEACSNGEFIVWVSPCLVSSWYLNRIACESEEIRLHQSVTITDPNLWTTGEQEILILKITLFQLSCALCQVDFVRDRSLN